MRMHVVSDLHVDIDGNAMAPLPDVGADVILCAGDARAPGTMALRQLRSMFEQTSAPILYVPGNHDFYSEGSRKAPLKLKTTWERQLTEMPRVAGEEGIHLLADSAIEIDGVRFLGGTLWTDMTARPVYMSITDAMRSARRMNDYRLIKREPGRSKDVLRPTDTIAAHRKTVAFLTERLATPFDGNTVVVTHHAPSHRSLHGGDDPELANFFDDLDWCYATDLEHLMQGAGAPALWLHGHIHSNRDYVVGNTRIVANPRGYPDYGRRENPHFDPGLVVEIEPRCSLGMRI